MVHAKLTSLNLENVTTLKLFCDGCPGQNKNITMVGMLMQWLYMTNSAVQEIHVIFPIVGHSFLPPDRIFGRIEKRVRKKEVIIDPKEYRSIFSEYATVLEMEKEIDIFDWKKAVQTTVKPPAQWHFQFSVAKRISLKKIEKSAAKTVFVKGEVNYRSDLGQYKSILKKGKSLASITPDPLPKKVPVKQEKLTDVDNLLKKHFGPDWRNLNDVDLTFYKNVIDNTGDMEDSDMETAEEDFEALTVEEDGLRI